MNLINWVAPQQRRKLCDFCVEPLPYPYLDAYKVVSRQQPGRREAATEASGMCACDRHVQALWNFVATLRAGRLGRTLA